MSSRLIIRGISSVFSLSLIIAGCSGDPKKPSGGSGGPGSVLHEKSQVIVHELSDPDMLQPIITTDAGAGYIMKNMFQALVEIDFKTLEFTPVLAEKRAVVEKTPNGGLSITFNLRKEATWDNGTPVTAKDVEFTIKAIKNPRVNNQAVKSSTDFISDIKLYPEDPLKVTFLCDTVYFLAESNCGGIQVIPQYFYDPKGLMNEFTVRQLTKEGSKLGDNVRIKDFASDMNSEKRMRDKAFISGSGPYKLEEWTTDRRIVLKRKEVYWGDKISASVPYLAALPDKLIYNSINDLTSALVALKAGNLDVMYSIKPKDFKELPQSKKFTENFNTQTPMMLSYLYIGLNTKDKLLTGVKTRQALAHLADVDRMINSVYYGLAKRVVGIVHPSNTKSYNTDITLYDFNIDKAKALLAEDGWKDSNGDGTVDKMIDGQKTEFKITFSVNAGNDMRKAIALMFQEAARKAGIEVTVVQQEWNTYRENCKKHKTEIFIGGWVTTPPGNDQKQIWHSESTLNDGDNYANFTNTRCDSLIDAIRVEIDENKRAAMYKTMQVIMHDEVPYIFLFAPTERIAIHKRFMNADGSVMRPGFNPSDFKLMATQ